MKLIYVIVSASLLTLGCSGWGMGTGKDNSASTGTPDTAESPSDSPDASAPDSAVVENRATVSPDASSGPQTDPGKINRTWECDWKVAAFSQDTPSPTTCSTSPVAVNGFYYAAQKEDGDMFVRVGVDSLHGTAPWSGSSSSSEWAAGTWEANNAAGWLLSDLCQSTVTQTQDEAATGNWTFTLDKDGGNLTGVYYDSDVRGGKTTIEASCVMGFY